MQGFWTLLAAWGLVCGAVAASVGALRTERQWGERLAAHFDDERRALACGRRAAFERNLDDGAALLAAAAPDDAAEFYAAAAAALDEAPAGGGRACDEEGATGFVVRLHKEVNPRLPAAWPNWIARFTKTADD